MKFGFKLSPLEYSIHKFFILRFDLVFDPTRPNETFLYIDKCHNSVMNYPNLHMRDIIGTNAYAKFE